ncbi:EbsA family protein [Marinilactibacillus piezotolerans]|uniref:EbsA family protein n=1 Tax=Marinilactibacillus piezotolerans TaxID=258723 RepID=UPI0009B07A8B|nr:EbsA family protein [Marinilactibacillus piezotolerans]
MNIKSSSKIRLNLEPAYQSMYYSSVFISFCIAIVFTTTLERLNWGTVLFVFIGLILLYLIRKATFVTIYRENLYLQYLAGVKKEEIPLKQIISVSISNESNQVSLLLSDQSTYLFHLTKNNQKLFVEKFEENFQLPIILQET